MRAALDNSISIIAPPSFKHSTSFPILIDGGMSTLLSWRGIDAISPNIALYLDSIQPYNTPDRKQRKGHFLHILNELWNEDKHCAFPLLSTTNAFGMIDHKPGEDVVSSSISRVMHEGTILMKVVSPYPECDFQPKFTFDIAFKDGPAANRSIETVLIDCHNGTKEILTHIIPGFAFDYPT